MIFVASSSFAQSTAASVQLANLTAIGEDNHDLPHDFPGLQKNADAIWAFINQNKESRQTLPPPLVYFSEFSATAQGEQWTAWQSEWLKSNLQVWRDWRCFIERKCSADEPITDEWIQDRLSRQTLPFPPHFLAFHYDSTNRIQMSPRNTMYRFYQNDHTGQKIDYVGYGYYVMGHEMLHYALEQTGVPGPLHHCIFVSETRNLMWQLSDFLIARKISQISLKRFAYSEEVRMDPCSKLSDQDRKDAADWAKALDVENFFSKAGSDNN